MVFNLRDLGGRRLGLERRRFSYTEHIPERRHGGDRRSGLDRRAGAERRNGRDRRLEARDLTSRTVKAPPNRRAAEDRRAGMDRREFMFV